MDNGTKLDPALTTGLMDTDMMTIGGAKGLMLQQPLLQSRWVVPVRSIVEEEEEKSLHLLGCILFKLQAFCEKTRNAHKKLKDSVPSFVKQLKTARGGRLAAQAPRLTQKSVVQVDTTPAMVVELPIIRDIGMDTPWWWPVLGALSKTQPEKQ